MSTIKPSDYGVWTRRNYPSLTEYERSLLCGRLSGMQASCATLLALATNARLRAVVLDAWISERALSLPVGRLTVDTTQEALTERLSRQE